MLLQLRGMKPGRGAAARLPSPCVEGEDCESLRGAGRWGVGGTPRGRLRLLAFGCRGPGPRVGAAATRAAACSAVRRPAGATAPPRCLGPPPPGRSPRLASPPLATARSSLAAVWVCGRKREGVLPRGTAAWGEVPKRNGAAPRRGAAMLVGGGWGWARGCRCRGAACRMRTGLSLSALEAKLRCVSVCASGASARVRVCVYVRVRAPGAVPHVGLTRQPRPDPGL